jgi:MoaA/NifB/PqqE/SkfB family radical SAM enzyme
MFKFEELEKIHIEITSNCQASCPMCARNYHGGIVNPNLKILEWTFDDFKNILSSEVLQQIVNLHICGTFGEPILNNDFIRMCKYLKDEKFKGRVTIHTNGSARNIDWWKELAHSLPSNHLVAFALDGLEDTHSLYRIGTQYEMILRNAKSFIDNGGRAEWAFIKFKHNEHQVDKAKEIAHQLKFWKFTVKNSKRFDGDSFEVLDKNDQKMYQLQPASDNTIVFFDKKMLNNYKQLQSQSKLKCQSKTNKEIYIDAAKNIFPCCYMAAEPYLYHWNHENVFFLKKQSKQEVEDIFEDLGGFQTASEGISIKKILNSETWQTVWNKHLSSVKPLVCVSNCGVHPDINATTDNQIIKKLYL